MGARKQYEEKIIELIRKIPEEKLAEVVSTIEKIKQEKTEKYIMAIEQEQDRFRYALSSTDQFSERKRKE